MGMRRLTIRNSDGTVSQPIDLRWADALEKLPTYEDAGLEPETVSKIRDVILEISGNIDRLR